MKNKTKLFCFTYAGGTSNFFNEIQKDLADIDVVKLEYAGHGIRYKESLYDDFKTLADDMFLRIKEHLVGEYALFGYSMGCITLVEVLQRIINEGCLLPRNVFLAAHEPHTKSEMIGFSSDDIDERIKERTIEFGGIPEKLLNNKVFWRTYLPLYRADYSLISKYNFDSLRLKTLIPATIFYSEHDTPLSEMELWKNYFIGYVDFYSYSGKHFFIREFHKSMAGIILKKLGSRL